MDVARAEVGLPPLQEQEPLRDFRFYHHHDDVERWALAYKNHGLLPDAGGLDQQIETKWLDIMTYLALLNEARQSADLQIELEEQRRGSASI